MKTKRIFALLYVLVISETADAENIGAKALFEGDGTSIAMSKDDEEITSPRKASSGKPRSTPYVSSAKTRDAPTYYKSAPKTQIAKSDNVKQVSNVSNNAKGNRKNPATVNSYGGIKYWVELDNGKSLQKVTTKYQFKSGDRIRLKVVPNISGYLSVYNRGTTGNVNLLYPGANAAVGRVLEKQEYTIPSTGLIRFDNNPGREEIGIFLSQTPIAGGNNPGDGIIQKTPATSYSDYQQPVPVSYNGCIGGKDLVPDMSCVGNQTGSKDLVLEEDRVSASPAEYAVAPITDLGSGKTVSISFSLKHN